ncbi:hypothetical protein PM082_002070 [Marasmius tenuissimus]|nr:hypothetical protein PM082_002070 [Marasmius tenuissimus]
MEFDEEMDWAYGDVDSDESMDLELEGEMELDHDRDDVEAPGGDGYGDEENQPERKERIMDIVVVDDGAERNEQGQRRGGGQGGCIWSFRSMGVLQQILRLRKLSKLHRRRRLRLERLPERPRGRKYLPPLMHLSNRLLFKIAWTGFLYTSRLLFFELEHVEFLWIRDMKK